MISKAKAGVSVLALVSAATFAGPVAAQDMGFYAGLSLGQASASDACDDLSGIPGISCDDKDTAWKILAGYQFNRHLAVELGYTNLGEVSATDGIDTVTVEATAIELVAVGMMPLANNFSIYGKIGMYRGDTEADVTGLPSVSESNTDLTFGLGVRYDFTRNLSARAEWQKYTDVGGGDIGESDIDVISLGVLFRF
jgi:OOP family OmpA-OmpF porin